MLKSKGFRVLGAPGSPVVPMMCYHPIKFPTFSRFLLDRGVATVVVAFPATPLTLGRARFCVSASHTKEDLDFALDQIDEIGELCLLKYDNHDKKAMRIAYEQAQKVYSTPQVPSTRSQ